MHGGHVVGGRYRILHHLGAGSMAELYAAVHLLTRKPVAIKIAGRNASDESVARLRREARATGAVESEYAIQIFDAGCDDPLGPYLVTELLQGDDLESLLFRRGALDPKTVAVLGYQVARGLAKAHAAGVIHRDVKPGNVFMAHLDEERWIAKIIDFGIAKILHDGRDEVDEFEAAAGVTLGTPQYMSPEQASAVADLDGRTDVWSLAATMYEAAAGRPPFLEDSPVALMQRLVSEDPPPLELVAPWVPRRVCKVIRGGLRRHRDARIPDATMFARAIADFIASDDRRDRRAADVAWIPGA